LIPRIFAKNVLVKKDVATMPSPILGVEELSSQLRPTLCHQFYLYCFLAAKNPTKMEELEFGARKRGTLSLDGFTVSAEFMTQVLYYINAICSFSAKNSRLLDLGLFWKERQWVY